jgi:hypothetical protein
MTSVTRNMSHVVRRSRILLVLAVLASGCSLHKSGSPDGTAATTFGLSVTPTASPDVLPRDGRSTSLVQLFVRDYQGNGVAGQRFTLSATTGTLSAIEVTTDSNGIATVRFTAPPANANASAATIALTPVLSARSVTSGTRTVVFALVSPSA